MNKDDVRAIADAYERKYSEPLASTLKRECSGRYKKLAIAWVSVPDALDEPNKPIEVPLVEKDDEDDKEEGEEKAPPPAEPEPEPESEVSDEEDEKPPPPATDDWKFEVAKASGVKVAPSIENDGHRVELGATTEVLVLLGPSFGKKDARVKLRMTSIELGCDGLTNEKTRTTLTAASSEWVYVGVASTPNMWRCGGSLKFHGAALAMDGTIRRCGKCARRATDGLGFQTGDEITLMYQASTQMVRVLVNEKKVISFLGIPENYRFAVSHYNLSSKEEAFRISCPTHVRRSVRRFCSAFLFGR
jgi:hypothetical protein